MRTFLLIALALFATTASAEIYTWKDNRGVTHYSDTPPPDKTIAVKTLPTPTGTTLPSPGPAPQTSAPKDNAKAERDKAAAESQRTACEQAKANLQALEDKPRRTAVGKGGKFVALDGEERAEEEARIRRAIAENCK